jgi:hypothetical protein
MENNGSCGSDGKRDMKTELGRGGKRKKDAASFMESFHCGIPVGPQRKKITLPLLFPDPVYDIPE